MAVLTQNILTKFIADLIGWGAAPLNPDGSVAAISGPTIEIVTEAPTAVRIRGSLAIRMDAGNVGLYQQVDDAGTWLPFATQSYVIALLGAAVLGSYDLVAARNSLLTRTIVAAGDVPMATVRVYAAIPPVSVGTVVFDAKVGGVSILSGGPFDLTSLAADTIVSIPLTGPQSLVTGSVIDLVVTASDDEITATGGLVAVLG